MFLCTLEHTEIWGPDVRLVWRDSTKVVELIEEEPEPSAQEPFYAPTVNVFEPIRFVEYAKSVERPDELRDEDWPETSTGSKIGGWTCWWPSGPLDYECPSAARPSGRRWRWRRTSRRATTSSGSSASRGT